MSQEIDSKALTSYALTEIMPLKNGSKSKEYFSFLIKNAGVEFIENIPALYDTLVSFGPYQLTKGAVGKEGHKVGGSTRINSVLPLPSQIPALALK